jgi:hypothetical protein
LWFCLPILTLKVLIFVSELYMVRAPNLNGECFKNAP